MRECYLPRHFESIKDAYFSFLILGPSMTLAMPLAVSYRPEPVFSGRCRGLIAELRTVLLAAQWSVSSASVQKSSPNTCI